MTLLRRKGWGVKSPRPERPKIDKTALAIQTTTKGTGKIDRTDSSLTIREPPRIVNSAFRASARGRVCDVHGCGRCDDSVVGAHIRESVAGFLGAAGAKPSDATLLFLCARCHDVLDGRRPVSPEEFRELLFRIILGFTTRREAAFRAAQSLKAMPLPILRVTKFPGIHR